MAKADIDTALGGLHGKIDGLVYKTYSYGTVVTRIPRMENVQWSPAQRAHRERVKAAAVFYRTVLADPALKKKFTAIAKRKHIPLSAVTLKEYMKQARE